MLALPDRTRNNVIAMVGEFVGTFLFLFFSFIGAQISNTPAPPKNAGPNTSNLLFVALAFGFSLTVNVWAFYRISGGLFNPAVGCPLSIGGFLLTKFEVTLSLCLVAGMPILRGVLIFISQLLGGIAAAAVVSALFPGPLNVGTRLGGGTSISQGLFIEMFLTAQLVFVIEMLAVVKHKSTFLAPVGIGLTFFLTQLCGMSAGEPIRRVARLTGHCRNILHRRFPQPRPIIGPRCGQSQFSRLPLDILGRPWPWVTPRVVLFQPPQTDAL